MAAKRPKYRLQPVLEQRQRRREEAERAVADAKEALRREMERLAGMMECKRELELKQEQLRAEFQALIGKPGVALAEQEVVAQKVREIDGAIARQRQAVRKAQIQIDLANEALLEAITDLKALEKHKENWEEQVRREQLAREQAVQEELGQTMWLQERQRAQRRGTHG